MVCLLDIVIGSCSLKALSIHEDCQGGKWRSSVNFWWVRFGECLAMARKINDCVRMMFSIVHWLQCATCLLADTVCEGREMMTRDGNEFWRSNIQFFSSCLGLKLCWFKWIYSYLALLLFPLQILILMEVCTVVALDIMELHTLKQLQCSVVYIAYLLYALFSCLVVSDSLRPHELQHGRSPCPSPTPGVHPNPCPLNWWCHPTISFSVTPFSCPWSFPASGSFPMSRLFSSGGQSIGVSF